MDIGLGGLWQLVTDREAWRTVVHEIAESDKTKQLNWTELNYTYEHAFIFYWWLYILSFEVATLTFYSFKKL